MGRIDWLYWVGGGGGGGGGGNSRSSSSTTKREKVRREIKETATTSASAGCMCAVFHLFHFHRNYSNTHPNIYPFLQQEATTTTTTGLEAPRNSLELSNETAAMDEASTPQKQEDNLNFPVGIIKKIKTSRKSNSRFDEINISSNCSSSCNSPAAAGAKTPSVVARLMGLDLLPESTSPSINSISISSRKDTNLLQRISFFDDHFSAARSLPETPRTSSSSRKSDVERHRLSLQINKEKEVFSLSDGRRGRSDNRRSFGHDITNRNQSITTDQNLSPLNPNKRNINSKVLSKYGDENNSPQSKIKPTTTSKSSRISSSYDSKKLVSKKLPARGAVDNRRRREDGFVRSRERNSKVVDLAENIKSKRRPLSCPTHTTHTKLPQKKSQVLDSLSTKSNTQLSSKPTVSPCSTNGGATALHGGASPEQRNYVQIILKHTGIINQENPLVKWHAPSQPIDPRLFHHLEFKTAAAATVDGCNTVLSRRCDRKLIFQLVDELLAEIFTHSCKLNRRNFPVGEEGCFPVMEELCKKIDGFPAAKCVVLEDIDSLIDRDLCKSQSNGFWGEEEDVVCEIEGEIMEWLVREAVAVMGGDAAEELMRTQTGICHVGL